MIVFLPVCVHACLFETICVRLFDCHRACVYLRAGGCAVFVYVCVRACVLDACMRACMRACVYACVYACVRACACLVASASAPASSRLVAAAMPKWMSCRPNSGVLEWN